MQGTEEAYRGLDVLTDGELFELASLAWRGRKTLPVF